MINPVDELRTVAAQLKRESDELVRRIEALSRSDIGSRGHDGLLTEEQVLLIAKRAVGLYEARSPRPPHVTIKQAAQMLGLSTRTVHNLMKAGQLRFNGCGKIPIEQVDMVLARSPKSSCADI